MEIEPNIVLYLLFSIFSIFYIFSKTAIYSIIRSIKLKKSDSEDQPDIAFFSRKILKKIDIVLISIHIFMFFTVATLGYCVYKLLLLNKFSYESIVFLFIYTILVQFIHHYFKYKTFSNPLKILNSISSFIFIIYYLLFPFVFVLNLLFNFTKIKLESENDLIASSESLKEIVQNSTAAGELDMQENIIIQSALGFNNTICSEVMTPRNDIVFIKETASFSELLELIEKNGVSRIPVCNNELDNIIGVIIAKDLLNFNDENFNINKVLRPVLKVRCSDNITKVLFRFRSTANQLAIVTDEHGGVDGVVSLEDILEEVFGEIFDEYDEPKDDEMVRQEKNGDLIFDASIDIPSVNKLIDSGIPDGEYDTLAGFIIHKIGKFPNINEIINFNNLKFVVLGIIDNRITEIKVEKPADAV